jgi:hypothetical protein
MHDQWWGLMVPEICHLPFRKICGLPKGRRLARGLDAETTALAREELERPGHP